MGQTDADGSKIYVAYYEYLFEGFSMFKLGYRKTGDVEFRESSVQHGAKEAVAARRFNMRDSKSKTLNFGTILHFTENNILSLMFKEYYFYDPDEDSSNQAESNSWTLAAFQPRNEPFTEIVVEYLKKSKTEYGWDI